MEITFYGHACFSIKTKGKTILFDPFISPNPKAKSVDVNKLTPDYILISHGHEDHLADAETIAKNADATLVSNFEIVTWYQKKGITKVHPMNHGGSWSFDFGTVKYTNAVHSSMMPDGSYGGNPGGFLIKNDEISFYYSGDTALTMDMKLIENSEKLDFAVLPIGDNFTMGIDDAIIASDFINCNKIIGVHYDTFGYIEINHKKAIEKFKAKGKELILLNIGQELEILR
ncbi:MAG: metal-dependent hydrolase [Bacteroidetes bacterium HGW-Bacteroidetes-12]|nr:MAG: metal-dependent hydrolase [Bacteroidetes bacterium HGW-Bacteroidetes-12]